MAKRIKKTSEQKFHKVMSEFKEGTLRSGSGQKVTDKDQAIAIAHPEAGTSRDKKHGG